MCVQHSSCVDGAPTGSGWPYCYTNPLQWPQASSDMNYALSPKTSNALPEDELVMHVRSGDSIEHQRDYMQKNAFLRGFDTAHMLSTSPPVQPSCSFHLDAALRGMAGKPFRKVHLLADPRYRCKSASDKSSSCINTNPCIAVLHAHLAPDVLMVLDPGIDNSAAFARDISLMARATNIALSCSTFSTLGRLASPNVRRLFVPDCELSLNFTTSEVAAGRATQSEFTFTPWSFMKKGDARTFSRDELVRGHMISIAWYTFPWKEAAAIKLVFGARSTVPSDDEWHNAWDQLFVDTGFNKTIYERHTEVR